MASSSSWLNYLNTIQAATPSPSSTNNASGLLAGINGDGAEDADAGVASAGLSLPSEDSPSFLSDDLRAQLEAWTTVTFDDPSLNEIWQSTTASVAAGNHNDLVQGADAASKLEDPSPYAKRQSSAALASQQQLLLERGFNAFAAPSLAASGTGTSQFGLDGFAALENLGVGVDGSNMLFANVSSPSLSSYSAAPPPPALTSAAAFPPSDPSRNTGSTAAGPRGHSADQQSGDGGSPPAKKQRTSSSTSAASNGDRFASTSAASTPAATPGTPGAGPSSSSLGPGGVPFKVPKQPLLTKAAILAAQAAELESKPAATPEEEAARQAELNRIAAEDDKRRRNTAASARFRVKKKQREHALEETVRELSTKIEKLEKDLESTKIENNFLRDLVIRKVGLADLPTPNNGGTTGRISGGQEGATGMGTV